MDRKLSFFRQLLLVGAGVWMWRFDDSGSMTETDAPHSEQSDLLSLLQPFLHERNIGNSHGEEDRAGNGLSASGKTSAFDPVFRSGGPFLIGTGGDIAWGLDYQKRRQFIAIGPVRFVDRTVIWSRERLRELRIEKNRPSAQQRLLKDITSLPVVQSTLFLSYLRMLHYCIDGRKILDEKITIPNLGVNGTDLLVRKKHDYSKVWEIEQTTFDRIASGNTEGEGILWKGSLLSNGVPLLGKSSLEQARVSLIVLSTLLSRTAMRGGVLPDVAYPLADAYVQRIMSSTSMTTMYRLGSQMYNDFSGAIHQARKLLPYPPVVREAIGYSLGHLDEPLHAKNIAHSIGYSPYYMTRMFHRATGRTFSHWLIERRIEKAQKLLRSTNMRIGQIAKECGFASRRYFTHRFSQKTGSSPEHYRYERHQPERRR